MGFMIRNTTGASMNPVRTLGPAIAAGNYKGIWIYMAAPTLGALAGAVAYTLIKLPEKLPTPQVNYIQALNFCLVTSP